MKIIVPIKRVIDYAIKIRVDPSKGPQGVGKLSCNTKIYYMSYIISFCHLVHVHISSLLFIKRYINIL